MFWLRTAVSLGLLAFLARRTNWTPVWPLLRGLDWSNWLVALGLCLGSQVVSAIRWRGLAAPLGFRYSQRRFLQHYFEGMFFSLCLPSSIGGDVVKACRLAPDTEGRVLAGCSVLADRLTGLAALLVIASATLVARQFDLNIWQTLVMGAAFLAAALAGVRLAFDALRWLTSRRVGGRTRGLWAKLIPYQARPEVMWQAVGWGMIVQVLNIATVIWVGRAMDLDIPTQAFFVAVPMVALMAAVPISINGVGIRESGLALILSWYGVPQALGVTLGLLWFLVTAASGLIGGLVYLLGPSYPSEAEQNCPTSEHDHLISTLDSSELALDRCLVPFDIQDTISFPRAPAMSVSVVVPIYNERENIRRLYDALQDVLPRLGKNYEIILVDDGSTDGSDRELQQLAKLDAHVKVVQFRRNFGQTAAMNAGIQMSSCDVIVTLDADLQNDPGDIPLLLAKLDEGFDLVHGWRQNRQDAFINRKLPSKIANWIISKATKFPVHDLGCTLKAMRRDIAQELQLYGEMHRFIPILAHWRGAKCAEIVTRHHARQFGTSKYGIGRTLRVVLDLITVKYMTQYLTSPMKLFGSLGLGCGLISALSLAATVAMKYTQDLHMSHNPLLLLTAFAAMIGVQFFVFGMLGEMGVRTYYESQGKTYYAVRKLTNFTTDDEVHATPAATQLRKHAA